MFSSQFNEWRKLAIADVSHTIAAWGKGATGFQMGHIRRQTRNLVKLSLLCCRVRYRPQQATGVRITRGTKQISGARSFKNLTGVHYYDVISHAGYDAEIVSN